MVVAIETEFLVALLMCPWLCEDDARTSAPSNFNWSASSQYIVDDPCRQFGWVSTAFVFSICTLQLR